MDKNTTTHDGQEPIEISELGEVAYEQTGKGGSYQIRKNGGKVEYVADQGTIYHPVTYYLIRKHSRNKGAILLQENPGRGSRAWLEAARALVSDMAAGEKRTDLPAIRARPLSDENPYTEISEEIQPTLDVIVASKALLQAIDRAGLQDTEIGDCVTRGLDMLRIRLADQLVERTAGGWLSAGSRKDK